MAPAAICRRNARVLGRIPELAAAGAPLCPSARLCPQLRERERLSLQPSLPPRQPRRSAAVVAPHRRRRLAAMASPRCRGDRLLMPTPTPTLSLTPAAGQALQMRAFRSARSRYGHRWTSRSCLKPISDDPLCLDTDVNTADTSVRS